MHINRRYADTCNLGVFFPYTPQEQRQRHSRVAAFFDHSVKQRRRGTTPCRTRHCLFLAGNHLCRCQVAGPWPYPDGWTFEAVCPWRASSRHAAPLDIFCALSEESSTSSDVRHFLQTAATSKCLRALGPENMHKYEIYVIKYFICTICKKKPKHAHKIGFYAKPVADSSGHGCRLGFCPRVSQADGGWRMNLSRTQTDIAQSCQAVQTVHDTYHILHSRHAKYFPISKRHSQYYECLLQIDGGSSEFFSLLASTSEFWCQKHRPHQLLLQEGYDANGQPLMVVLGQFWDHAVSMHRIHTQDHRHRSLLLKIKAKNMQNMHKHATYV